jgi:transcriptional regulator with XRE-family HTH domain
VPRSPRRANASDPSSDDLAVRVGARIRRIRVTQRISLSALASESGLAKGTLSELETGQRNPTLDTLFAVTTALNTPLSSLLADSARGPTELEALTGRGVRARLLLRHDSATERSEVYAVDIHEALHESEPHGPGVSETLMVLEGNVRVGNPGALRRVSAGDSWSFAGDRPHQYQADGGMATGVLVMRYPLSRG